MDRDAKQKLQMLWRNRFLVSIGILVVSGLSAVQIQFLLSSPVWTQETQIKLKKAQAQVQKQIQTQENSVEFWDQKIKNLKTKVQDANAEVERLKNLLRDLDRETQKQQNKAHNLRDKAMRVSILETQAQKDFVLAEKNRSFGVRGSKRQVNGAMIRMNRAKARRGILDGKIETQDSWVEDIKTQVAEVKAQKNQVQKKLYSALAELRFAQEYQVEALDKLEEAQHWTNNNWLIFLKEENLFIAVLQSLIILYILLTIFRVLFSLINRPSSLSHLPLRDQFIYVFFPEECMGEINALHHRMKKAKASPLEINLRLLTEIITLLWAFYVPIKLENLFLPSDNRKIDD